MLDDVYKVHVFIKGNEHIGVKEKQREDTGVLDVSFSEIQNLKIQRNPDPREKRLTLSFDTECFKVFIETDIINASELFDMAQFVQKDDMQRIQESLPE